MPRQACLTKILSKNLPKIHVGVRATQNITVKVKNTSGRSQWQCLRWRYAASRGMLRRLFCCCRRQHLHFADHRCLCGLVHPSPGAHLPHPSLQSARHEGERMALLHSCGRQNGVRPTRLRCETLAIADSPLYVCCAPSGTYQHGMLTRQRYVFGLCGPRKSVCVTVLYHCSPSYSYMASNWQNTPNKRDMKPASMRAP